MLMLLVNSEVYAGMRAFKVKTNIEVSRQKGDGEVQNHGTNKLMAWKSPIQGASYTSNPSVAERIKEENEVHNTSETFLASDKPELVLFIQESDYQSVKDIFIDREVHSRSGLNYKDISSKFQQDVETKSQEPRKTLSIMSSISNEIEQDFKNYVRKQYALGNLMEDGEEDSNRRDNRLLDKSTEKWILGMQHVEEFQIEDSVSLKHMEPSAAESIDENSHLIEVSSHTEADSGSTTHFSLSGPIPCSGSSSLRSTSSSASNHSFAFPILPSEWNGSPVRMVEADQRERRNHQSWRTCFLCCKF